MANWKDRAERGLVLFEGAGSDEGDSTWQILNHILDESNRDDYISADFFNVQQTAGGLPPGLSFEKFVSMISGHVRSQLEGSSFGDDISDDDFKTALLTFDDAIRRHIRFLNGVVHQAAPGEVHTGLWELILATRSDDRSIYSCYRDYLVEV
jgi:hypothetical protein